MAPQELRQSDHQIEVRLALGHHISELRIKEVLQGQGGPLLVELHDPPNALFVRGSVEALQEPGVAVVGARSCSAYGAQVARSLYSLQFV